MKNLKFWISKSEKGNFARVTVADANGSKTFAIRSFPYDFKSLGELLGIETENVDNTKVKFVVSTFEGDDGEEKMVIKMVVYDNMGNWVGSRMLKKNFNYSMEEIVGYANGIVEHRKANPLKDKSDVKEEVKTEKKKKAKEIVKNENNDDLPF